jgi:ribosomal protein S21
MITVKKGETESAESLIRRFSRRVVQSGVIREAKGQRYYRKEVNKNQRRKDAIVANQYRARRAATFTKSR